MFVTLLTAFQTLLHRYSGQSRIIVGSPMGARPQSQAEEVIGLFLNMVPLLADFEDNPDFCSLLERNSRRLLGACSNQNVPFQLLVKELGASRSSARHPLFQAVFQYLPGPVAPPQLPGIQISELPMETGTAKFDLTLTLIDTPSGIAGDLEYNTDLFDRAMIERMISHLRVLLESVIANPLRPVGSLPILTSPEECDLVSRFNNTARPYPRDTSIAGVFSMQAEATPDSVALISGPKFITYRELEARSNQLAHHIFKQGVRPGALVGVCMERSIDLVVTLLATLKAGAAYVPLDPNYPQERLAFMIADTSAPVIITNAELALRLFGSTGKRLVCLDWEGDVIAREPVARPGVEATGGSLAYVMYTSGSTGQPKGVAVPQRAVVRLVKGADYCSFDSNETFLLFAPISFDASTFEIWGALLNGARLVIAPPQLTSLEDLGELLRANQVTTLWLTAGLFHQMVDCHIDSLRGIKNLLAGGDVLSAAHVSKAARALPGTRLINGYGPTENTTFTCCFTVPGQWPADRPLPVGRPISNTQVYILDKYRNLAPIGVVGELYAAGDGLAVEYLNAPNLTEQKFVALTLADGATRRLYRTGDLVRWLPDGNIEFIGRVDHQLKIRGFRVEPGEIERALAIHPAIRECVIAPRDDAFGQKRLVAWMTPKPNRTLAVSDVRTWLQSKLPAHLIPSQFVILDEMPLNPNGKVDRSRLPLSDDVAPGAFRPPNTPNEKLLAHIWSEALGGRTIGLDDNFFESGGHSLLAVRIISKIAKETGVTLTLRDFFERPSLLALAALLEHPVQNTVAQAICAQPLNPNADYPLSFQQQRLWFVDQLRSASPLYSVPIAWQIKGNLDSSALESALQTIISRHETLHTICVSPDNNPAQRIIDPPQFKLSVSDLAEDPLATQTLATELAAEACRPFDLRTDLMLRARLFKLSPRDYTLFINIHHIAFDEWSLEILERELATLYSAALLHRSSLLPPLAIQYRDFALWQRRTNSEGAYEADISFWKERLAQLGPPLEFPADHPRPDTPPCRGQLEMRRLPSTLVAALKGLSHHENVTLYTLLLAGFELLVNRYTGRDDVIIGIPVSGRDHAETQSLIGFFVNMLPLRADLSGDPSFHELLTRIRSSVFDAMEHQQAPFEKIVEALHASRGRLPLFNIVFSFERAAKGLNFPGLETRSILLHPGVAKFDLTLVVRERDEDLETLLEYDSSLFDPATATRILAHFETLLSGITANPQSQISKVPILSPAERAQLLFEWNRTATSFPREEAIDTLFQAQVRKTPDAIAVQYGGESITYRELDERSTRLAACLQRLGAQAGTPIGTFLRRSVDMIVAWLGILKSGGAYVPIDLEHPREWIDFVLQDTRMPVIISKREFADRLPQSATPVLDIENALKDEPAPLPQPRPFSPERMAYIIYTSGSTGRPKGVAVSHRAIVRLVFDTNYIHLDGSERMAQVSNSAFDAATFEVWGALLHGGTLVGAQKDVILSPAQFVEFLGREQITTMFLTTALFNQVAAEIPDAFKSLKHLLFGGEACDPESARRVRANGAPQHLLNVYGPTESTTFASWHEIDSIPQNARSVPIGQPLANTTLFVLDQHLQPVPIGVAGELYIGGDGLARGYFNRPELTAERFIENPFSTDPNSRLYKTGDLARRLADGEIDYIGRLDHQVKIRGFRIEPGEIEAVLKQAPGIKDALVLVRQDSPGEKRLAAYCVGDGQLAPVPAAIRQFLKEKLPPYMVPSSFHILSAFPLTPNGKVDRRALPAPGAEQEAAVHCPPRTELEIQLYDVWRSVLGHSAFGIRDDFFEIGGHSLLAVRLVAEIEKAIGITLQVPILFQAATVEKLARALSQNAPFAPGSCLVRIQPSGSKPPVFWPHTLGGGAGGGLFTYRKLAQLLGPEQPSYGFVAPSEPFTSIETMAAHYIEEMKRIQPVGPYYLGGYCFAGVVAYEMACQLRERGDEVALLALLDSAPPDPTGECTRASFKLLLHFLGTFPAWLREFWAQDRGNLHKTLKWRIGIWREKARRLFWSRKTAVISIHRPEQLEELVDMSAYPQEYRRFALVHWRAFTSYHPRPFNGKAILFRGDERHLLRLDGIETWRSLVLRGLEVQKIPGKHEAILAEPHVRVLAEKLCAALARQK